MFRILIADRCTVVEKEDVDLSPILSLGEATVCDLLTPAELRARAESADALICNKAVVDRALIEACPRLKYVGLFAPGYNNVDLAAADERGVTVCNVPGYSTHSVAQQVFAFLLAWATSLPAYDRTVHSGEWCRSAAFTYLTQPMTEIRGKTLGVFGYGAIGRTVAKLGDAFGMKVIVHTRTAPKDCPYELVGREELFRRSDVLTLHCPLNEGTRDLVNRGTLSLMKPTALLINTSRGGVVVEEDLRDALERGVIAGAGIDVVREEPMREDNPLLGAPHCLFTPHTAWATIEARRRLVTMVAENLAAFQEGRPVHVVNHPR